ncbi:hypothetical protein NC652_005033 [Populus alba x Populus x berolinensis]|nr:hypothetical protein NC652_005033 [Populus alba x Populus x berolinensis]
MVTKAQSITAINVGTSKAQTNKLLRYGNDGLGLGNNGMQDDVEELGLQLSDDRKKRWVGLQESGSEDMCLEGYEFQVGPSFSTNKISSPDRVPMFIETQVVKGLETMHVYDLMVDNGSRWDAQMIDSPFQNRNAIAIQGIPLSSRGVGDKLIWHFSKDGRFNVKFAYRLAMEICGPDLVEAVQGA